MTSKGFRRAMLICMWIVLAFMYIPIIAIIFMSFNKTQYGGFPYVFTTQWYRTLFTTSNLLPAAMFSLRFSFLVTIVAVVFGTLCAYGMQYFFDRMKVLHILTIRPARRSKIHGEMIRKAEESGIPLQIQPGPELKWSSGGRNIKTFLKKDQFSFDILEKENKVLIRMVADENGETEIRILKNGRMLERLRLPGEMKLRMIRRDLNR